MPKRTLSDPNFKLAQGIHKMTVAAGMPLDEVTAARVKERRQCLDHMRIHGLSRPRVYPGPKLKLIEETPISGCYLLSRWGGKGVNAKAIKIKVMEEVSLERMGDGDELVWWHVSLSRVDGKMPTYHDIAEVRSVVMGNRWCVQYFPPSDRYVNDHPTCLHLWHCLEKEILPDFRRFGTI